MNKLESPSPKDALCQVLVEIGEEDENVKSSQTDRQTERRTFDQKSSLELSAQVS